MDKLLSRAKKQMDTESTAYHDLKKLVNKAAMNEERKDKQDDLSNYRSQNHRMDIQSNMSYGKCISLFIEVNISSYLYISTFLTLDPKDAYH